MLGILFDIVVLAVVFGIGAVVGSHSKVTVEKAITALKTAEADATAVIAKIANHKAS